MINWTLRPCRTMAAAAVGAGALPVQDTRGLIRVLIFLLSKNTSAGTKILPENVCDRSQYQLQESFLVILC
jgi:hypothetical protein